MEEKIEFEKLKEELKKELIEELKAQKNLKKTTESAWTRVRKEYAQKFKKYDYKLVLDFFNVYNKLVKNERDIKVAEHMIGAIGTLIKAVYETPNIQRIPAEYDEIKDFVEDIYQVLEKHKKRVLDGRRN